MAPPSRRRSTLFIGALALDALPAALASGADVLCIDLEDAVPPDRKDDGRRALHRALDAGSCGAAGASPALIARINPLTTPEGRADLQALAARPGALTALLLPKVESDDEVLACAAELERAGAALDIYAIIETAVGLELAAAIAIASPRLKALYFGGFDLSAALGCDMAWEPLLYARSRVVHAAALAGIDCCDSPYPAVDDAAGLADACRRAKALGMTGKAAKSAAQIAAIHRAFTPTRSERDRARRILAAFNADPTRPLFFEGRLYERPAIRRLEQVAAAQIDDGAEGA